MQLTNPFPTSDALSATRSVSQDPSKEPGDLGDGTYCQPGAIWVRYEDVPGFSGKEFKLNAERNNGRAAMLGITGCLIHELLGVDALYPTGGMEGAAPPTIF